MELIMFSTIFRVISLCALTHSCVIDVSSPKFKLVKNNARLENHIVTRKEISTLEECSALAITKKALAFNFSPILRKKHSDFMTRFNCQVLACAEVKSLDSVIDDKRFNYYSAYSRKLMLGNKKRLYRY